MKWFLILWALPLSLLGAWYGLSYYDINFGTQFFSRDLHDLVFQIYGNLLGMEPETIPGLVLKAILVDTVIVIGLIMLKRRGHSLYTGFKSLFARRSDKPADIETTQSEASLSSAP